MKSIPSLGVTPKLWSEDMLDYTAFASFARSAPPFNLSLDSGREAYYQLGFIFRQTTTALAPILS